MRPLRRNWRACEPSAPGRSGPRNASGGICAPEPDRRRPWARLTPGRRSPATALGQHRRHRCYPSREFRSWGEGGLSLRRAQTGGWTVGGWTKTRPGSLGLLPSGPDPVGERYVPRQPPGSYLDHERAGRKRRARRGALTPPSPAPQPWHAQSEWSPGLPGIASRARASHHLASQNGHVHHMGQICGN